VEGGAGRFLPPPFRGKTQPWENAEGRGLTSDEQVANIPLALRGKREGGRKEGGRDEVHLLPYRHFSTREGNEGRGEKFSGPAALDDLSLHPRKREKRREKKKKGKGKKGV